MKCERSLELKWYDSIINILDGCNFCQDCVVKQWMRLEKKSYLGDCLRLHECVCEGLDVLDVLDGVISALEVFDPPPFNHSIC